MAVATSSLLSPPIHHQFSCNSSAKTSIRHCSITRRTFAAKIFAKSGDNDDDGDDKTPSFNPFGFVTDNPSSRSAIQLPESPADDGNVGQMISYDNGLMLILMLMLIVY
ncbi:F-BAR domain only protein 1 [Bienertia sinuspersici]